MKNSEWSNYETDFFGMSARERKIAKEKEFLAKARKLKDDNKNLKSENHSLKESLEQHKIENHLLRKKLEDLNKFEAEQIPKAQDIIIHPKENISPPAKEFKEKRFDDDNKFNIEHKLEPIQSKEEKHKKSSGKKASKAKKKLLINPILIDTDLGSGGFTDQEQREILKEAKESIFRERIDGLIKNNPNSESEEFKVKLEEIKNRLGARTADYDKIIIEQLKFHEKVIKDAKRKAEIAKAKIARENKPINVFKKLIKQSNIDVTDKNLLKEYITENCNDRADIMDNFDYLYAIVSFNNFMEVNNILNASVLERLFNDPQLERLFNNPEFEEFFNMQEYIVYISTLTEFSPDSEVSQDIKIIRILMKQIKSHVPEETRQIVLNAKKELYNQVQLKLRYEEMERAKNTLGAAVSKQQVGSDHSKYNIAEQCFIVNLEKMKSENKNEDEIIEFIAATIFSEKLVKLIFKEPSFLVKLADARKIAREKDEQVKTQKKQKELEAQKKGEEKVKKRQDGLEKVKKLLQEQMNEE